MSQNLTMQRTSKTWKLIQAIGFVGFCASVAWIFVLIYDATPGHPNILIAYAAILSLLFFLMLMAGRVGAWWQSG